MYEFGCMRIHALEHCPMVMAAVSVHPMFELGGKVSMATFVSCRRCECKGGDDKLASVDDRLPLCGHCGGTCWCDGRYWNGPDEDGGDFGETTCISCLGTGIVCRE